MNTLDSEYRADTQDAPEGEGITGRDNDIVRKALAYAIEAIDQLPERWEASDREGMECLLRALSPIDGDFYRLAARSHLQRRGLRRGANGMLVLGERDPIDVVQLREA